MFRTKYYSVISIADIKTAKLQRMAMCHYNKSRQLVCIVTETILMKIC